MRAFSQQTTASLLLLLPALFSLIPTALAAVDTNTLSGLMQDPNFFHKIQGCKQTFTEHAAAAQIRAAFHDAGTFSTQDNSGGADGSLQTEDELQRKDNTWIRPAINYLKPFVSDGVSMSDLIALAGVGAVKACGGPRIDFYAGRKDGASPNPTGRLPGNESTVTEIKSMFARMGLSVRDTVALAGAHTVGGIRLNNNFARLDFVPFDSTPTIFDNQIFKEILDGTARMAFNLDLATDPETRPIVEEFANDQDAFFRQFAESFKKMTLLGAPAAESMKMLDTTNIANLSDSPNTTTPASQKSGAIAPISSSWRVSVLVGLGSLIASALYL